MAINLVKGQNINLSKEAPGLKNIKVGLGWDTNRFGSQNFDLDASVMILGENEKALNKNDKNFVYFGNKESENGMVKHFGDNLTGAGDGDDEVITVDLDKAANASKIIFLVNIYQAASRSQNFGQVDNAYIRLINDDTKEEIIRYDLTEDFSIETGVLVGELYKKDGEWKFKALGNGSTDTLQGHLSRYGF